MNTIEAMAIKYSELFGKEMAKEEISIIIYDFTIRMQQEAIEDKDFEAALSIIEYSDKVRNTEIIKNKEI